MISKDALDFLKTLIASTVPLIGVFVGLRVNVHNEQRKREFEFEKQRLELRRDALYDLIALINDGTPLTYECFYERRALEGIIDVLKDKDLLEQAKKAIREESTTMRSSYESKYKQLQLITLNWLKVAERISPHLTRDELLTTTVDSLKTSVLQVASQPTSYLIEAKLHTSPWELQAAIIAPFIDECRELARRADTELIQFVAGKPSRRSGLLAK